MSEKTEGKITTTEWKTDVPLPVVGFSLGDFTMKEAKVQNKQGGSLTIDAYANNETPDVSLAATTMIDRSTYSYAIGTMGTSQCCPWS